MAQITSGMRSLLSFPFAYSLLQNLLGARAGRKEFVDRYVRAKAGDRVLDIGCGPADIVEHLPGVEYFGFDLSRKYIRMAKNRYGHLATFRCEDVTTQTLDTLNEFDIVLAIGILHHLDDEESMKLLNLARSPLKQGGRLVTLDACFTEDQSRIARLLISRDRGRNVRQEEEYRQLIASVFREVKVDIRHDLTWLPYTHIIMEANG